MKKQQEKKTIFTGSYGIVIEPDIRTKIKARVLATFLTPHAGYLVETPHITLYHAKFTDLPIDEVKRVLEEINYLQSLWFTLRELQIFGEKFLFWNIEKDDLIQKAHEKTLLLSKYRNKKAIAKALEEKLTLTKQEIDNLNKYGHPLTDSLYLPHITLAYDQGGIMLNPEEISFTEHSMQVHKIHFVEIGLYGSVKNIINL